MHAFYSLEIDMDSQPDPLTAEFPNLLRSLDSQEQTIEVITFDTADVEELPPSKQDQHDEDVVMVGEVMGVGPDEPIPGDDTMTLIFALERKGRRHRGRRRAPRVPLYKRLAAVHIPAAAVFAVIGLASLLYGLTVQLFLAPEHPLMAAISIPSLVFAGALLAGAVIEKR